MNRLTRRISLLLCVVMLTVVFAPVALAEEEEVSLPYIPCPMGGRHQMYAVSSAFIRNNNVTITTGTAYQCPSCLLVIATQNLMAGASFPGYAGHYSVASWYEPINTYYVYIETGYQGYNTNWQNVQLLASCDWY